MDEVAAELQFHILYIQFNSLLMSRKVEVSSFHKESANQNKTRTRSVTGIQI